MLDSAVEDSIFPRASKQFENERANLRGIVQSVTPSMPGKLNSTCVLVLLFIFKLHFLNTTIVSLMYIVEYTYQGFIVCVCTPVNLCIINYTFIFMICIHL